MSMTKRKIVAVVALAFAMTLGTGAAAQATEPHTPETVEVTWLLPETVTALPTGNTPAIWPQTHLPDGVVPCGRFAQVDTYNVEDVPALIADGKLHEGEDYSVVISWRFVAGPECDTYTPPVLDCGDWEVPGIINEHGDPTSCVSNHPCPGLDAPACEPPAVVVPEPEVPVSEPRPVVEVVAEELQATTPEEPIKTLPVTGPENVLYAGLGAGLLMAGAGAIIISRRFTTI